MIDIEEYYNKYGSTVYKRCLFLLKNEDEALDAMQTVFAKLLSKKKDSRTIAVMHYIDKMNLSEIADEMHMSVSGIKKRLKKIKDKINIKEEYYAQQS